jgi:ribosomal protein L11 methyltransferase
MNQEGKPVEWLEISLSVDGEGAEAVAEVLSRFAPNGVMTEQGIRHRDDEDLGTAAGPITVRAYIAANEQTQDTRRQIEQALHYLGMIQPLPAPSYRKIADTNWMDAWKQHYRPIPIGRRLLILPAWLSSSEADRVAVKIDPGMAFGTGTHPSTQLCMAFLDELIGDSQMAPGDFIDVGCGSGILSIAALKLGATRALGVDIDEQAILNARENANTNGLGTELTLGLGSVREIIAGRFGLTSAHIVAANILAPVILRLLDDGLARLVNPAGHMILAGILQHQEGEVTEGCRSAALHVENRRSMGDWIALCVSR